MRLEQDSPRVSCWDDDVKQREDPASDGNFGLGVVEEAGVPVSNTVTFGGLLRHHRMAAGLSRESLARRAGLSTDAIDLLERGRRRAPRPDTLERLAATLDLDPAARAALIAAAMEARARGATGQWHSRDGAQTLGSNSLPSLAGRGREIDLLQRHLAGSGPPVLVWAGEPGIGKSRLLYESIMRAAGYGLRVLTGSCQRRGGREPYAPLPDALLSYFRHHPAQPRRALKGCAWLVRLLPELAGIPIEPLPTWALSSEQERRLLFAAVARFMANVAGPGGTLLVLDELQWAGPDALDLLASLVQVWPNTPVRVVGAYRDTELQPPDPLAGVLADLTRAGLAVHHTLAPLSPAEAEQLLAGLLPGTDRESEERQEHVLRRSGGVPFFIVSCAQALRAGERAQARDGAVPWNVAQGVQQRIATLPHPAQEVLSAVAVIGGVAPPGLLLHVVEQPERDVLVGLQAACTARLLVEEERGYRFAYDLIREVVEAEIGAAKRLVLRRRLAVALDGAPGEATYRRRRSRGLRRASRVPIARSPA
jgi:transcriptional regulator with XRE-family HTH domain